MDVLNRITLMRKERHWTEYQLAEKSGLTQSTISSWYRKNTLPSIPSLQKICDAYEVTLSQFFADNCENAVQLNDKQFEMLNAISKLNSSQQLSLLDFLNKL